MDANNSNFSIEILIKAHGNEYSIKTNSETASEVITDFAGLMMSAGYLPESIKDGMDEYLEQH